jgi:hypothetical protein
MAPFALVIFALAASINAYDIRRTTAASSGTIKTEVIPTAEFYVPLTGKVARSAYKKHFLNTLRNQVSKSFNYTAVLAGSMTDKEYLTDITIGGQEFKVIVDTGS